MDFSAGGSRLAKRLKQLGFDETLFNYGINGIWPKQNPSPDLSQAMQTAGTLWSICLEHENQDSDKMVDGEDSQVDYIHDKTLIAMIKSKSCYVWLDAFMQNRELWPSSLVLELASWICNACESLATVHQYSTIYSLIERAQMDLYSRLDGMSNQDAQTIVHQETSQCGESCDSVGTSVKPALFKIRILIWHSISSIEIGINTCKSAFLEVDKNIDTCLRKMKGWNHGIRLEIQCYHLKLEAGMRFLRAEEYDHASDIFHDLALNLGQLKEKIKSAKGEETLLKEFHEMNNRLMTCLSWSHVCQGGNHVFQNGYHDSLTMVMNVLDALNRLEDNKSSEEYALSIQIEFCKKLDEFMEGNPILVKGLVFACSKLMVEMHHLIPVLTVYASQLYDSKVHRKAFLLGMLANICEFLGNPRFDGIPGSTILVYNIVSNAIVLEHLQGNLKMALNVFSLIWNAAVDATNYSSKQGFLKVGLILAEILQDPDLNRQILIHLSYTNLRYDKVDLALKYAKEAGPFDRSQTFKLVMIEIMLENAEIEIETTETFVKSVFDLKIMSLERSIYLVCMSLEKQNYLMAGILLDSTLSVCVDKDVASDDPSLVPIMLQNFFAVALDTRHPYLMSKMFHWMDKCNAGILDTLGGLLQNEDQNICIRRYLAYQAFTISCAEFRKGIYSNTMTAALFASTLLDPSPMHEIPFQFLLASQLCLLIAIYALFRLEDGFNAADPLIALLKERSCKILKSCPDESKDKLQRFLYYEKYMILLHHLHGGDDALAEDVLMSIESQMGEKGAIDILYELVQSHRKHDKIMLLHLHTSLKRIRKDASENSQVYSDILRIILHQVDQEAYIKAIEEFHRMYKSMPKDTFPDQFIEWLYISCWNYAIRRLKENIVDESGKRAVIISLEGFHRAQIFCQADMAVLTERAQRLSKPHVRD